jgi:small-conductance mechanosensitive channel
VITQPELTVPDLLAPEFLQDFGVAVGAIVVAYVLSALLTAGAVKLTARTESDLDDAVIAELRPAVFLGLLAFAGWMSLDNLYLSGRGEYLATGVLGSVAAFVLGRAVYRVGMLLVHFFGRPGRTGRRLDRRLVPLAEYALQLVVSLVTVYAILVAWELHGTLLGTSAGALGLALGLAAEGSLANVIAGLFIAVDRPCRVGDFVVHGKNRGRVTHIGLRSIRLLTTDGVEIIIPNALLVHARIVNETGGPDETMRLVTDFALPHGADLDRVRRLLDVDLPPMRGLAPGRRPEFRVLALGERGVTVGVYYWLSEPSMRTPGTNSINTWLYKQLTAAGVEFALPRHDVHLDPATLPSLT